MNWSCLFLNQLCSQLYHSLRVFLLVCSCCNNLAHTIEIIKDVLLKLQTNVLAFFLKNCSYSSIENFIQLHNIFLLFVLFLCLFQEFSNSVQINWLVSFLKPCCEVCGKVVHKLVTHVLLSTSIGDEGPLGILNVDHEMEI